MARREGAKAHCTWYPTTGAPLCLAGGCQLTSIHLLPFPAPKQCPMMSTGLRHKKCCREASHCIKVMHVVPVSCRCKGTEGAAAAVLKEAAGLQGLGPMAFTAPTLKQNSTSGSSPCSM